MKPSIDSPTNINININSSINPMHVEKLPPFIDAPETCHYFNDMLVLSTNEICQNFANTMEEKEIMEEVQSTIEEFRTLQDESKNIDIDTTTVKDDDDDYINCIQFDEFTSEYDDIPKQYEDIFDPKIDLFIVPEIPSNIVQNQLIQAQKELSKFTRRVHLSQSYMFNKRSEFLRLCFKRALLQENENKSQEDEGTKKEASLANGEQDSIATTSKASESVAKSPSTSTSPVRKQVFGTFVKRLAMELELPLLQPRKWPHLPYRDPSLWGTDIENVVQFLSKLSQLPAASLLYDPFDDHMFIKNVHNYLKKLNVPIIEVDGELMENYSIDKTIQLPESAVAGFIALFGVGVQLQSFSTLSNLALQLLYCGGGTTIKKEHLRPELANALIKFAKHFRDFSNLQPELPILSRSTLVNQWKLSACSPCSSDAIASDNEYLYILCRNGLFKIGTGRGNTIQDRVYAHNSSYSRSREAERSWLCCIGNFLYARTITMARDRIDRISTAKLDQIEELSLGPIESKFTHAVSQSSVYALVTDGKDLYSIRCFDTHKLAQSGAPTDSSSHQAKKLLRHHSKKLPLKMMIKSELMRSSSISYKEGSTSTSNTSDGSIHVGDRVVRGPDWKWSNQDGEKGGVGTVERISTWGGVAGSGVTVRWDKNDRVNTYRWGAEGCYDLIIVVEKDGCVIERQELPRKTAAGNKDSGSGAERAASTKSSSNSDHPPRHQFLLYRHDVNLLFPVGNLREQELEIYLGPSTASASNSLLTSRLSENQKSCGSSTSSRETKLSTLHSHKLANCDILTGWMCDGGQPECLSDAALQRFRCVAQCDYDLCEACLHSTIVEKSESELSKEENVNVEKDNKSEVTQSLDRTAEESDKATNLPSQDTNKNEYEAEVVEATQSDIEITYDDSEKDSIKADSDYILKQLHTSWRGYYSIAECKIALRRSNNSIYKASQWLWSNAKLLRSNTIISTISVHPLTVKNGCYGAIDPVLLLAGSFYISNEKLCIISPPGVYSVNDDQPEAVKRAANTCDACWYFSISTGELIDSNSHRLSSRNSQSTSDGPRSDKTILQSTISLDEYCPVLLSNVQSGSPICIHPSQKFLLVFSPSSSSLDVYENPASVVLTINEEKKSSQWPADTLECLGEYILLYLMRYMSKRFYMPKYKHMGTGLHDLLSHYAKHSTDEKTLSPAASKITTTRHTIWNYRFAEDVDKLETTEPYAAQDVRQKTIARTLKNLRQRVVAYDKMNLPERFGYTIPYTVDFDQIGIISICRLILSSYGAKDVKSLASGIYLLVEMIKEFENANFTFKHSTICQHNVMNAIANLLLEISQGNCSELLSVAAEGHIQVVELGQMALLHGIRCHLWCREGQHSVLDSTIQSILEMCNEGLPISYFQLMTMHHNTSIFDLYTSQSDVKWCSKVECKVLLLRNLLLHPHDKSRLAVAEVLSGRKHTSKLLKSLFDLAILEFQHYIALSNHSEHHNLRSPSTCKLCLQIISIDCGCLRCTPVSRTIHALFNYSSMRLFSLHTNDDKNDLKYDSVREFEYFATNCIQACLRVIEIVESDIHDIILYNAMRKNMSASIVGTILPLVLSTVSNIPTQISQVLQDLLLKLLMVMNKLIDQYCSNIVTSGCTIPIRYDKKHTQSRILNGNSIRNDCSDQYVEWTYTDDVVIESTHPYASMQFPYRRVVTIPGAFCLHFEFDPRCRTTGEGDLLLITQGSSNLQSDQLPIGSDIFGAHGGCFFGNFESGNWPAKGFTILGDTATIILCTTSVQKSQNAVGDRGNASRSSGVGNISSSSSFEDLTRWGFKCVVRGLIQAPVTSSAGSEIDSLWIVDTCVAIANTCGTVAQELIRSVPTQPVEQKLSKWPNYDYGLFQTTLLDSGSIKFLQDMVQFNNKSNGRSLCNTIIEMAHAGKRFVNKEDNKYSIWTKALSMIATVLVAKSGRLAKLSTLYDEAIDKTVLDDLANQIRKFDKWMIREVQLLKEWNYLCVDKVPIDEMIERYASDPAKVKEFLELLNIEALNDLDDNIRRLHEATSSSQYPNLTHEVENKKENWHDFVANRVITKCWFVLEKTYGLTESHGLQTKNSITKQDSPDWSIGVDSIEPPNFSLGVPTHTSDSSNSQLFFSFIKSQIDVVSLKECCKIHNYRLVQRSRGFSILMNSLTSVTSVHLKSHFLGRLHGTLPVCQGNDETTITRTVFSGCMLGSREHFQRLDLIADKYQDLLCNYLKDLKTGGSYSSVTAYCMVLADLCVMCNYDTQDIMDCPKKLPDLLINALSSTAYCIITLAPDATFGCSSSKFSSGHHVFSTLWIFLRIFSQKCYKLVCTLRQETGELQQTSKKMLEKLMHILSDLFQYFSEQFLTEISVENDDKALHVGDLNMGLLRVLCLQLQGSAYLINHPIERKKLLRESLQLIYNHQVPSHLTVAAIRVCRRILNSIPQDEPLEIQNSYWNLRDIAERLGRLLDIFSTDDHDFSKNGQSWCVIIFQNDDAEKYVSQAVDQYGPPDIEHYGGLLNLSDVVTLDQTSTSNDTSDLSVSNMQTPDATSNATSDASPSSNTDQSSDQNVSMVHPTVRCDGCNQSPLLGYRFKCFSCPNYDLCATCYTNNVHFVDHEFVRMSIIDGSLQGSGDLLRSRSRGSGIVSEKELLGSPQWKGGVLLSNLNAKGYALYKRFGYIEKKACIEFAENLSSLGLSTTVVNSQTLEKLDSVNDWETHISTLFLPGNSQVNLRGGTAAFSVSSAELPQQKGDRSLMMAFNRNAQKLNHAVSIPVKNTIHKPLQQFEDVESVSSELVALGRELIIKLHRHGHTSDVNDILHLVLADTATVLKIPSIKQGYNLSSDYKMHYYRGIGTACLLGGFCEPLRQGSAVIRKSFRRSRTNYSNAPTSGRGIFTSISSPFDGTVWKFDRGSTNVLIWAYASNGEEAVTIKNPSNPLPLLVYPVTEVIAVPQVVLDDSIIKEIEILVPCFCSILRNIHETMMATSSDNNLPEWWMIRFTELSSMLLRAFGSLMLSWPSIFDNQVMSSYGNAPNVLYELASQCRRDVKMNSLENIRNRIWKFAWLKERGLHLMHTTRPLSNDSFVQGNDNVLQPLISSNSAEDSQSKSDSADCTFYNLYAYSSRRDLPQSSGQNKLLEYWEKHVIPAIEAYVSGSFKTYEMDYFFAQLREPLREGNGAAAMKIAYTLCDGHVPSGCKYPDPDTDWSALQIDDVYIGNRYLIACNDVNCLNALPKEAWWTIGCSGVAQVKNPLAELVLLEVIHPGTNVVESWWYHVDALTLPVTNGSSDNCFQSLEPTALDFETALQELKHLNRELICCSARRSVFDLLTIAPEDLELLIVTKEKDKDKTENGSGQFSLSELLHMAAAEDLGCPTKLKDPMKTSTGAIVTSTISHILIETKSLISQTNDLFSPARNQLERDVSFSGSLSWEVGQGASKPVNFTRMNHPGELVGKLQCAFAIAVKRALTRDSVSASVASNFLSSNSNTRKKNGTDNTDKYHLKKSRSPHSNQISGVSADAFYTTQGQSESVSPKMPLQQGNLNEHCNEYLLDIIASLSIELKKSLEACSHKLQTESLLVTSDSPPKPIVKIHIPHSTCLVLSFVVHPVLMDLPAGSSLEFFKDEHCTEKIFGYLGEKRGLNMLPPLLVPGDCCYVKMTAGSYARYKFQVHPFTSDFGLALWICEEIYSLFISCLSGTAKSVLIQIEAHLSKVIALIVDLLTSTHLPSMASNTVFDILSKFINFAIQHKMLQAVPVLKFNRVIHDMIESYECEKVHQKGRFSTYTQQMVELLSLVEEVALLSNNESNLDKAKSLVNSANSNSLLWWDDVIRLAVFSRALHTRIDESTAKTRKNSVILDSSQHLEDLHENTGECCKTPLHELEVAHKLLSERDFYGERLIFLQRVPKTSNVEELKTQLNQFLVHIALDECGQVDDPSVRTAADVTRFGVCAKILYLPIDKSTGETSGFAVVDMGRSDIITNLIVRLQQEFFQFSHGEETAEDPVLIDAIKLYNAERAVDGTETSEIIKKEEDQSASEVWVCTICTLENPLTEDICGACGSPIPAELAENHRQRHSGVSNTPDVRPSDERDDSPDENNSSEWICGSCSSRNNQDILSCHACNAERSVNNEQPNVPNDQIQAENEESTTNNVKKAEKFQLSALSLVDVINASSGLISQEKEGLWQISSFLKHWFLAAENIEAGASAGIALAKNLRSIVECEFAGKHENLGNKNALDQLMSLIRNFQSGKEESLEAVNSVSQLTCDEICDNLSEIVCTYPEKVYAWLRSCGYDLQFTSSHYTRMEDVVLSQSKWTHAMDVQLVARTKEDSNAIGVVSLLEFCPSRINSANAITYNNEYPLLSSLESRDLRLRFMVLKALNHLLWHSLPLINMKRGTDAKSFASRIVGNRQIIFPSVKINFFTSTQDNTSVVLSSSSSDSGGFASSGNKRPTVIIDRRNISSNQPAGRPVSLNDFRSSLFASSMNQLRDVPTSHLRSKRPAGASDPYLSFTVIFTGEHVVGEGGPYRQLFQDISTELLSTGNSLFCPTQNNVNKIGEYRERFVPCPGATTRELFEMYEFVGILMGCCLRTGVRMNLRLAPIVWKLLVKQTVSVSDLEAIDYSLCESLKCLEALAVDTTSISSTDETDFDIFYESFTTTLTDGTIVELKNNGWHTPVTSRNVKEYVKLVKSARLQESKPQINAILRGIDKVFPTQLLSLCVWSELQLWICGSPVVDIELLKRHTRYSSGMTPEKYPHLQMFWNVLTSFTEENKRRFINFAWGQDSLPADDAEFDRTHTRLLIKSPPAGDDQDKLLPKADTCFFNIELPAYSSESVMREKLLLAITLCTSMDGDDRAGHIDVYYGEEGEDDIGD